MSWWGKLFGGTFGFMLGGPLGALIGAALGHNIDEKIGRLGAGGQSWGGSERIQTAFFTATFSVMGHVAKADGRVSEDEIRLAEAVMAQMQLNDRLRKLARRLFDEGKQADFPLDDVLDQLKRECRNRRTLLRMFLEVLIQAGYADGVMHQAEKKLLLHIASQLGFSQEEFAQLESMIRAGFSGGEGVSPEQKLEKSYEMLNVSPQASDDEVKKAYRRLMNQHHPDKLVAKGLPEEMMKLAADKTHEIKQAYDFIRKTRKG